MYGNYPRLARQVVESIVSRCERAQYHLVVGCNACCDETLQFLQSVEQIDRLIVSLDNINKCPMQRRMFEQIDTEFVWWFDDDSWIDGDRSLQMRLEIADAAPPETVLWGPIFYRNDQAGFNFGVDVDQWIRAQLWYSREPIPSDVSGKWVFVIGASWFARMSALKQLNWPPASFIKAGDDAILCEAIRQSGLRFEQIGECGVKFQTHDRRAPESKEMMLAQVKLP